MMMKIYNLKRDKKYIELVQKASLSDSGFGIQQTHGLYGSDQWWENIHTGKLPTVTKEGIITKVYMGSMNDWPEFKMETNDGEELTWSRFANGPDLGKAYVEGARVEVDYVMQKYKEELRKSNGGTLDTKCVIEVRVDVKI